MHAQDRRGEQRRAAGAEFRGGRGAEVDNEIELTRGVAEAVDLASEPIEFRPQCQTWQLTGEKRGVSAEQRGGNLDAEYIIGGDYAFEQPLSEEACSAGNEQTRAAYFRPNIVGMGEDMFQVPGRQDGQPVYRSTPRNSPILSAA